MANAQILMHESLRGQALHILKTRVLMGDFKAGEIYSSTAIAQELGVSNSPIREALLSLVDLGLMEAVRNRGFRVVEFDEASRRKIIEIRLMLEVPTVVKVLGVRDRIAAKRDEIEDFLAEIETCAEKGDFVGYLAADRKFHLAIIEVLENEYLNDIIGQLRDQTRLYGLKNVYASGRLVREAETHRELFHAILNGSAEEVAQMMADHIRANAEDSYQPTAVHILVNGWEAAKEGRVSNLTAAT